MAKAMDENTLLQVQAVINAKKDKLTYEDARALAERALEFIAYTGVAVSQ